MQYDHKKCWHCLIVSMVFFISYSTSFAQNRVGCPVEGTFGVIEGTFKVFGPNTMYTQCILQLFTVVCEDVRAILMNVSIFFLFSYQVIWFTTERINMLRRVKLAEFVELLWSIQVVLSVIILVKNDFQFW